MRGRLLRRILGLGALVSLALGAGLSGRASAATIDPRGTWNSNLHCVSAGGCTDLGSTLTVDAFDPTSGTFSGKWAGAYPQGTAAGTISGATVHLVTTSHPSWGTRVTTWDGSISADGLTWIGSGSDKNTANSSAGAPGEIAGTFTLRYQGPLGGLPAATQARPSAGAATSVVNFDPRGTWKSTYHCLVGWCAKQDFPGTLTITTFDPSTGAFTGDYSGETATGTVSGNTVTATFTIGSYISNATFTISADGASWTGTGSDSRQTSGTFTVVLASKASATATPSASPTTPTTSSTPASGAAAAPSKATPAQTPVTSVASPAPGPKHSTLLDIPTPGDALTAKNVALAGLLTVVLLLLVAFPSTLFNNTLEANLDTFRSWLPPFVRRKPTDAGPGGPARPSYWQTWQGFVTYMVVADVLYSRMQPGFGFNRGTLHTFVGFLVGTAVTTGIGITMTRTYLRRYGAVHGHMEVEFGTLAFAVVCVVASRLANFVPGYFYGVIAAYVPSRKPSDDDGGRMGVRTVVVTYVLAVAAWFLLDPLDHVARHGGMFAQFPRSIAGGMVVGGVEAILIGLTPLRFLPGHKLRTWNQRIWLAAYSGGAFLFSLILLKPGLVSAKESSVAWTLVLAGFFGASSLAMWWYFNRRDARVATAGASLPPPAPPAVVDAPDGARTP